MTVKDEVDLAIQTEEILVYSKSYCPYCRAAKETLASVPYKNSEPKIFELDQMGDKGGEIQTYLLEKTGQKTVPNIFIRGTHVGGSSDLKKIYDNGELKTLLSPP